MSNIRKLMESELEKAEITLAIKDVSDSLQKMASDISRITVDDLPAIVERIKVTHGVNIGNEFGQTVSDQLNTLIQEILDTKSAIDDKTLVISGDANETDIRIDDVQNDLGGEEEIDLDIEEPDGEEMELDLDLGDDEPSLGRRVKESYPLKVKGLLESCNPKQRKIIKEMYHSSKENRKKVLELARNRKK